MAGFALLIDEKGPISAQSPTWADFLHSVGCYKGLELVGGQVEGDFYVAAKLDASCSLHRGITRDSETGSWLMAVGSVLDAEGARRDADLSSLLYDFGQRGEVAFDRLDGQFALVAYHGRENSLRVISDPFGLIPVYYGQDQARLYLSTSALAVARAIQSVPDEMELRSFLLYGDTLQGSLWKDVRTMKPATVFTITPEKNVQHSYWSFHLDSEIGRLPLNQAVDCLIDGVSQTIQKIFAQEGQCWLSLTGGLDSRTLAGLAYYNRAPFKTYCHGPSDARDVRLSASISRQMGWAHMYFALPDDWGRQRVDWLPKAIGQSDGQIDVLKMARMIREQTLKDGQMNASLWGYGGEIYRGYYWKQEFGKTGQTPQVDYERLLNYRVIPGDVTFLRDNDRWQSLLREAKSNQLRAVGEHQPDLLNTMKLDLIGQYLERHPGSNMVGGILGGQRVYLPYYSKVNITRIMSTNHHWRTHSRMFRLILERINPRLASFETADGGPALPMRLSNAYQFIPYWFDSGEKLLWKLGRKYLGKSFWGRRDAGPAGKAYPISRWLQDTACLLREQAFLNLDQMLSIDLYDASRLQEFLNSAWQGNLASETLFSRIITIEMALRAPGNRL